MVDRISEAGFRERYLIGESILGWTILALKCTLKNHPKASLSLKPFHPSPGRRETNNSHFHIKLPCGASKEYMKALT